VWFALGDFQVFPQGEQGIWSEPGARG
jgi:hypothetical protein